MQKEKSELCIKQAVHFTEAFGVDCAVLNLSEQRFCCAPPDFCASCSKNGGECLCENTHLYGCYEAERWQGKYIYYCPDGLIFMACLAGGLSGIVAGPVVMGDLADFLAEKKETGSEIKRYDNLPIWSTGKVNAVCETLSLACKSLKLEQEEETVFADSDMLNMMYTLSEGAVPYPIDSEKLLLEAIKSGNKPEAQRLLNQLLGHIYFCSGCNFKIIKIRVTELLVLLSRASIEGGADIEDVFGLSEEYFKEIDKHHNLEELSIWLTGVMHRYISYVFDFLQVKHSDVIYKTMQYVKARYSEKITLEDIAKNVYLSKSYLCKLFKDETGVNITCYINELRVEKSKAMLLDQAIGIADIATLTGFVDQSYYTKVFKKIVGVSPGRYRESSGRITH